MKKLILLLIPLFLTSLFSEWSKIGNKEFLNLPNKIEHYSISADEKILFWIDTTGYFYKYDLVAGTQISKIMIPNYSNGPYKKNNWGFVSTDNLTYIHSNVVHLSATIIKFSYFIYRISDNFLIDSVIYSYDTKSSSYYQYHSENKFADYYTDTKKLIVSSIIEESSSGPNVGSSSFGISNIYSKKEAEWINLHKYNSALNALFYNNKRDLLFFNLYYDSYYLMKSDHKVYSYYSAYSTIYDTNTDLTDSFYKFDSTSYKYGYVFNSGFFDTGNNIVLSTGKQFFKFNNQDFEIPQIFDKDKRDLSIDFYIVKSKTSEEFFSFSGNKINLYTNDFKLNSIHQITEFTKINSIYHLSNTDELLIYDGNIKLLKISKDNLFKGIADFSLPKYTFMTEDTLNFTNHTYGDNLEYFWDFGDSTTSNEKHPNKVYYKIGTYVVKLVVKRGNDQTEVEKNVTIYPRFTANFEYTISGSFPKYISYKNTSTGVISSFTWYFETDSLRNKSDTIREYFIPGDYKIKLVAYANGLSSTKEVTIRLDFDGIQSDTNIVKIEYFFDKIGSEALKGYYEGNGRIIYLISSDSIKQIGLIKKDTENWHRILNNEHYNLLRLDNGIFKILDFNTMTNCSINGSETNKNNLILKNNYNINDSRFFINNNKNIFQALTSIKSYSNYIDVHILDENNQVIDTSSHKVFFIHPLINTNYHFYDCKFVGNSNYLDFYYSFHFDGSTDGVYGQYYSHDVVYLNEIRLDNFPKYINKIERLNDSLLFTAHTDSILRINILPLQRNDSLKKVHPSKYNSHIVFKHKDFKFSYFHFLNDSLIVFSGNKKGKPAFLVLNKDLELIKEYVVEERIGSFNHISQATNNRLLFSGYCYKEFGKKQPYFALIEDAFFPLNDRIIDTIPQDTVTTKIDTIDIYCYPNPTSEKLNINVGLSKPAKYNLKIFNSLGLLEYELKNQNYNNTDMKIEINLEKFSNGMYFFELDINGITKTDKFIYFRGN